MTIRWLFLAVACITLGGCASSPTLIIDNQTDHEVQTLVNLPSRLCIGWPLRSHRIETTVAPGERRLLHRRSPGSVRADSYSTLIHVAVARADNGWDVWSIHCEDAGRHHMRMSNEGTESSIIMFTPERRITHVVAKQRSELVRIIGP